MQSGALLANLAVSMNLLGLDVGNTHLHLGVMRGGKVRWREAVPTPRTHADAEGLGVMLQELAHSSHPPQAIAYCSVVPAATELLRAVLQATGWPVFQLTWEECAPLGLPLEYPHPAQIGQDRLALAFGASTFHGKPVVAIDLGTAVTFDVINHRGAYEGGIIAPGLALMTCYLHERTALLPALDPHDLATTASIGKSTIEAMKIGCSAGFAGMIQALLERVLKELRERDEGEVKVVATGGSAVSLSRMGLGDIIFDPDLLMRGLEEAWRRKHSPK
jgi:type III pantothenate kinase